MKYSKVKIIDINKALKKHIDNKIFEKRILESPNKKLIGPYLSFRHVYQQQDVSSRKY